MPYCVSSCESAALAKGGACGQGRHSSFASNKELILFHRGNHRYGSYPSGENATCLYTTSFRDVIRSITTDWQPVSAVGRPKLTSSGHSRGLALRFKLPPGSTGQPPWSWLVAWSQTMVQWLDWWSEHITEHLVLWHLQSLLYKPQQCHERLLE